MSEKYALVGDIGGSTIRLSIYEINYERKTWKEHFKLHDDPFNWTSLDDCIYKFISSFRDLNHRDVDYGVLGIAGPVIQGTIEFTNLKWPAFNSIEFSRKANIKNGLVFVNDFVAQSYYITHNMSRFKLLTKNGSLNQPDTISCVVGVGTGLGQSILINGISLPSELAHTKIHKSQFKKHIEVLDFMAKEYRLNEACWETICSSNGLVHLLNFYNKKYNYNIEVSYEKKDEKTMIKILADLMKQETYGDMDNKPFQEEFIDLMNAVFANYIITLILSVQPYNGIYLTGGIVALFYEIFQENLVEKIFEYSEEYFHSCKKIIENIPIYLLEKEHIFKSGINGALIKVLKQYGIDYIE